MWGLNPRGLSTTDLAGLPHTRLGESRPNTNLYSKPVSADAVPNFWLSIVLFSFCKFSRAYFN